MGGHRARGAYSTRGQTALRPPRGGSGLPRPLYPPGSNIERPPGQRQCQRCRLPLEGLPHQTRRPTKGDAADHARVHSPLPDPYPAAFRQHALHAPAGQWTGSTASGIAACWPARPARPTSRRSAPCPASSSMNSSPDRGQSPRPPPSPCANHAPAAVAPCASSKSSTTGKTDVARTTQRAGRMTHRLSGAAERHRLHPADPVRTSRAHPPSARNTTAIKPNRTSLPGPSWWIVPLLGTMRPFSRTLDPAGAPTLGSLSP